MNCINLQSTKTIGIVVRWSFGIHVTIFLLCLGLFPTFICLPHNRIEAFSDSIREREFHRQTLISTHNDGNIPSLDLHDVSDAKWMSRTFRGESSQHLSGNGISMSEIDALQAL